jgi:FMN reductase
VVARRLVVVAAGLSQPSSTRLLADRLGESVVRQLREADVEIDVQIIELRERAQDLANNLLTGFPSPSLRNCVEAVVTADGLVAVSPIFNASFSGLFKTFFDVLELDSLSGMPVLIAATGGSPRHSLALEHALRPLFAYLSAAVVPTAVFAATGDWGEEGGGERVHVALADRINRAAGELARAIASNPPRTATDPFANPVSFESLLDAGRSVRREPE